jgi:hypothetical protein
MTTPGETRVANALAVHFCPEPFNAYAWPQLAAHPLFVPGICARPSCSREFVPGRDWAVYCSPSCRAADTQEFRRIGLKAAPALLAWRMGKYERATGNRDLRALSCAGRSYVSGLASGWFKSRRETAQSRSKDVRQQ